LYSEKEKTKIEILGTESLGVRGLSFRAVAALKRAGPEEGKE